MKFTLPKIYPITDIQLSGITHAEQVERLIEGGAELIQIREKHASPKEFYEDAKMALEIARTRSVKILINDRVDIAIAIKADGVHLGQDDLPPEYARKILGDDAIIGFSTHLVDQAVTAAALPIDYLAIGPIFSTSTKENPDPVVGLAGLQTVRKSIGSFPLVAIGGINRNNIREVFAAGADSAAMIGAVVSEGQLIAERMREFDRLTSIV